MKQLEITSVGKSLFAGTLLVCLILTNGSLMSTLFASGERQPEVLLWGLLGVLVCSEIALLIRPLFSDSLFSLPGDRSLQVAAGHWRRSYELSIRGLVCLLVLLSGVSLGSIFWWGPILTLAGISVALMVSTQNVTEVSLTVKSLAGETNVLPTLRQPFQTNDVADLTDANITHKLMRRLRHEEDETQDELEAFYRLRFRVSEESHVIHLPLHPAFAVKPAVDVEVVDDALSESIRFNVSEIKTYGVRIEVKRSGSLLETISVDLAILVYAPVASAESAA